MRIAILFPSLHSYLSPSLTDLSDQSTFSLSAIEERRGLSPANFTEGRHVLSCYPLCSRVQHTTLSFSPVSDSEAPVSLVVLMLNVFLVTLAQPAAVWTDWPQFSPSPAVELQKCLLC